MNAEQETELLGQFKGMGFEDEALERECLRKIALGLPGFMLYSKKKYGDEQIRFEINIGIDPDTDTYFVKQIHASHRGQLPILHREISGVVTSRLEQHMAEIDWEKFFASSATDFTDREKLLLKQIMKSLLELETGPDPQGRTIQEQLKCKYWPASEHDLTTTNSSFGFYSGHTYYISDGAFFHVHMAYHTLTERLHDIKGQLEEIGLNEFMNIEETLEHLLSSDPDSFQINCSQNTAYGYASFDIPISKRVGWFSYDEYSLTFTPYSEINHGIYNAVDSAKLERMMSRINWRDERILFLEDTPQNTQHFKPEIAAIDELLFRLSQDMVGVDIADQLRLKYLLDVPYFSRHFPQTTWDLFHSLPARQQNFPIEIDMHSAISLHCGKAVFPGTVIPQVCSADDWIKLSGAPADYVLPFVAITGYPEKALIQSLNMLPVDRLGFYTKLPSLKQGLAVAFSLNNREQVLIQADPEQKTVRVYTPDHMVIPVNLEFDPSWRASEGQLIDAQQNSKISRPHHKKEKGQSGSLRQRNNS